MVYTILYHIKMVMTGEFGNGNIPSCNTYKDGDDWGVVHVFFKPTYDICDEHGYSEDILRI